jgi:hypothetical protein
LLTRVPIDRTLCNGADKANGAYLGQRKRGVSLSGLANHDKRAESARLLTLDIRVKPLASHKGSGSNPDESVDGRESPPG